MSDFERELREIRERQRREAESARSAILGEAEEKKKSEEELRLRILRERKEQIEKYVLPVRRMVERALLTVGNQQWGSGNCGLSFTRYDDRSPYVSANALARFEVGQDEYTHFRNFGILGNRRPAATPPNIVGKHESYAIPIGQTPSRGDSFSERHYFGVSLIVADESSPFFGIIRDYDDGRISARTQGNGERELEGLLLQQFEKGPLGLLHRRHEDHHVARYSPSDPKAVFDMRSG